MRDPGRIKNMLLMLESAWRKNPDLRLGQILVNAAGDDDLFYVEDSILLSRVVHGVPQVTADDTKVTTEEHT